MRLATVEQSREIDELSHKAYNMSGELLMEAAGALSAKEIALSYYPELKKGSVHILCGPGNNGGDGLVLARHLHASGYRNIVVFTLAPFQKSSALFKQQFQRIEKFGIKHIDLIENPEKTEQLRSAHLIVDALFGIGLSSSLKEQYLNIVDLVNAIQVPVVSLDCPSGLDCDLGVALNGVVRANMTLTFGLAKPGFFVGDGPSSVGKLRVLSIGFPYECVRGVATTHFAFTEKLARRYLPKRGEKTNKSDHGHVLAFSGSPDLPGAGVMSVLSAYRMGAGYVTWAGAGIKNLKQLENAPEVLYAQSDDLSLWDKNITAALIGPGFGVNEHTRDLIQKLKEKDFPVVLDADGLSTCVKFDLFPVPHNWVLTPHTGEMSKIIKKEVHEIERDRYKAVLEGVQITGGHLLLKGFRSVMAYNDRVMVILSGNSALAKAGTGDVLSGMIAGLLAQGLETLQASATACYIHGRMADEWVRVGNDHQSLLASDLTNHLPQLMSRLRGGALI